MHHYFARSLYFLQSIKCNIIKITCAIQISLFVSHYLFKQIISSCLSLLLFQQQIISTGYLIMLIILYISNSLIKITIWLNLTSNETIRYFTKELFDDRDSVFTDYYAFYFVGFYLVVPFVVTDFWDGYAFSWVCVQNFLNQILARLGNKPRYKIITIKNLFIKFTSIRIFKRQVSTCHSIQYNPTTPDVRDKTLVPLACDHLWSCVAR